MISVSTKTGPIQSKNSRFGWLVNSARVWLVEEQDDNMDSLERTHPPVLLLDEDLQGVHNANFYTNI